VLVEGPFARNTLYLEMLVAATGRSVIASEGSATGTSIGAALLVSGGNRPPEAGSRSGSIAQDAASDLEPPFNPAFRAYAEIWRSQVYKTL
jgi:sugar (pentulose or hexulose) kinase